MEQTKIYKGIDLLDMIFEFVEMVPDKGEWRPDALKKNPPRYIRFMQIESLISAFGDRKNDMGFIGRMQSWMAKDDRPDIASILSGDFIKSRRLEEYQELVDFMYAFINYNPEWLSPIKGTDELVLSYLQLVKYKRLVKNLLAFNSGWLAAGTVTAQFSIRVTNSVSLHLDGKYGDIDYALELFINPRKIIFTEEELKSGYKFPKEDLKSVDMDWV